MLTLGQASCLALSLPPTDENRMTAKRIFNESVFEVTYLKDADPMVPVAIGKNAKELNPFLYNSYPETPPTSPRRTIEEQEDEAVSLVDIRQDYTDTGMTTNHNNREEMDMRNNQEQKINQVIPPKRRGRSSAKNLTITQLTKPSTTTAPVERVKRYSVAKAHLGPQNKTTFKVNTSATRSTRIGRKKNTTAAADNISSATPSQGRTSGSSSPKGSRAKTTETAAATNNTATLSQTDATGSTTASINCDNMKRSISKSKVLNYLKQVLYTRVPVETDKYDALFITSQDQMEIVKEHFNVGAALNQKTLASWVARADFLSYLTTSNGLRGRWLYVLKKEHRNEIVLQK